MLLEWQLDCVEFPFTENKDARDSSEQEFKMTPSALLTDPTFFPEDQNLARQAQQTKQKPWNW